ncbi:F/Y rich C-terminus-domain-containing protein [Syncephalis plumigaleata]|nr:F/Y rich C-terminus-domain-containing protein [Syncephalis plumigaleata]
MTMDIASPTDMITTSDVNNNTSIILILIHNEVKLESTSSISNGHGSESQEKSGMSAEERYQRMKRKLQLVLDENERIAGQLDQANLRITRLRREKSLLLDRLVKTTDKHADYEGGSDEESSPLAKPLSSNAPIIPVNSAMIAEAEQKAATRQALSKRVAAQLLQMSQAGVAYNSALNSRSNDSTTTNVSSSNYMGSQAASASNTSMTNVQSIPMAKTASSGGSRPRRNRRIITQTRKVQPIPRDANGRPILPVQVGILTIISLGTVVYDREAFHNERYIWPVGYTYPDKQTIYTCSVRDGVDGPKFYLEPEDQPDGVIEANTATGAWTTAVRLANRVRQREHSNSASGPDYFGFSHPTIAMLIQELPEAEKCKNYVFQKFEEMKPRRAARSKAINQRYTPKKRKSKPQDKLEGEEDEGREDDEEDEEEEEEIEGDEEGFADTAEDDEEDDDDDDEEASSQMGMDISYTDPMDDDEHDHHDDDDDAHTHDHDVDPINEPSAHYNNDNDNRIMYDQSPHPDEEEELDI